MQGIQESGSGRYPVGGASLRTLLDAYERQLIETALAATSGNQRRAARTLGLLPTTLHEKMKRLGLLKRRNGFSQIEDEAKLA